MKTFVNRPQKLHTTANVCVKNGVVPRETGRIALSAAYILKLMLRLVYHMKPCSEHLRQIFEKLQTTLSEGVGPTA